MRILRYKGIAFDEWTKDEFGVWAEICQECAEKHWDSIKDVIDEGTSAIGCCSVAGCSNKGNDDEKKHFYIDFDTKFVSYEQITLKENEGSSGADALEHVCEDKQKG